jgi:radical SAM protein with 4Fe4S-binding SPASM domain
LVQLTVSDMTPPTREPCRRLHRRAMVLSDGRVARCDQDVGGTACLGTLLEQPLAEIWRDAHTLRADDIAGRHDSLCGGCREWQAW